MSGYRKQRKRREGTEKRRKKLDRESKAWYNATVVRNGRGTEERLAKVRKEAGRTEAERSKADARKQSGRKRKAPETADRPF